MGSRSRDRGGGSAGGPVAELSLPRFAILTAVPRGCAQSAVFGTVSAQTDQFKC